MRTLPVERLGPVKIVLAAVQGPGFAISIPLAGGLAVSLHREPSQAAEDFPLPDK